MPSNRSSVAVLIPARYGSTRFPGKALVSIEGKPMIQHIYEAACQGQWVTTVRVVTDDQRIQATVQAFGGAVSIIDQPCRTGTDRVAAGAQDLEEEIIVNWQADEVPCAPGLLDELIAPFVQDRTAQMGTLMRKAQPSDNPADPSVVKVVTDRQGRALYFSRAHIPYLRDHSSGRRNNRCWLHLGLYIFRRETLLRFAKLPTGTWEEAEQLEQLRALEFGIPIHVWETRIQSLRIDTPEDLVHASR